jgi:hypothetical protein
VFLKVVHCVVIGNDGLVYVCDRLGGRIEVFDKMGNFQRNIVVESKTARFAGVGSACWMGRSLWLTSPGWMARSGFWIAERDRLYQASAGQVIRLGNSGAFIAWRSTRRVTSSWGDAANGRRIQMWRSVK